ncbi:MAG: glycosyl transferase family 36 [candidate division KSB1 bacterium]|nr:glycosyl transferase family 36 [candidate division KSB1 bacterium]
MGREAFETPYGFFREEGWEYVIKTPLTPRPWINVISNGSYGLIISQTGGGFSWLEDCNENRITRWYQDLILDNWGKFFYVKDETEGLVWSPTFRPVGVMPELFRCVHGIGYSIFQAAQSGLVAELRVFVPWDRNLEVWTLKLQNRSRKRRRLSVFTYLEWCLGVAFDQHREFHRLFLETEYDPELRVLYARKRLWEVPSERGHWNRSWPWIAFLAASEGPESFETDKYRFLGEGSTLACPAAVRQGRLSCSVGKWGDGIGSFHQSFELEPGEEREWHLFLGVVGEIGESQDLVREFRAAGRVESAFQEVRERWRRLLAKTWVETPDPGLNLLVNIWLKYQAISGRLWGRAGYYQQSGAYGFRDQLQDSQIFFYLDPNQARQQIRRHAEHQFPDGHALHWWHPLTDRGHDGPVSDNYLWLPLLVANYVKETGDFSALQQPVAFYGAEEKAPLLEHCLRAVDLALTRISPRGLPLILGGDWNDGLNAVGLEGKGESIWLAHFLIYVLRHLAELLRRIGRSDLAEGYEEKIARLRQALNEHGWDGAWFVRATKDSGEPIGSRQNECGRIFLNAQTWAVIAGSCDPERQWQAFQSALELLQCDAGPRLLAPAYRSPDPEIGYLTRYAPGVRENGGVYVHAATWAMWAACELGLPHLAYRLYLQISPVERGQAPDLYQVEPYVVAGHIHGSDSPYCGRGGWTWYTGSAAWLVRVVLDHLIGVRADYEGLRVKPCYPPEWGEVRLRRFFRGRTYEFTLVHDCRLEPGQRQVEVDGQLLPLGADVVPLVEKDPVGVRVRWRAAGEKAEL